MRPRAASFLVSAALGLAALLLAACQKPVPPRVIVLGVDGMDPGFVERHWADLPNLDRLRHQGGFSPLATTTPPQSPVAWSTFITGLDPAEHGILDFVHRDPATRQPYLSTARTTGPRFTLPLGPYSLPLSGARIESLRKGKAFWETLDERGIPVTIIRIPANYPPLHAGREISGMGSPDLMGTQGTFSFYTDDPAEVTRSVPGGSIRKVEFANGHADLELSGPPNPLRLDAATTTTRISVDVDSERAGAVLEVGGQRRILMQGEWSEWIPVEFRLAGPFVKAKGMVRVFAQQLRGGFRVYVSPVNIDPLAPALPISHPASFAGEFGRFFTLGIPEDTAALRQGIFTLPDFIGQIRLVLDGERRMLRQSLDKFQGGFLFFYFSSVDQASHILWARHDAELLEVYKAVDASIGEAMAREPSAKLIVMSDHGFTSFDRGVNLNAALSGTGASAMGLNGVYLDGADSAAVQRRLLELRDPETGAQVVTTVSKGGKPGPDLIVGYAPGYRASWRTGIGETSPSVFETNADAWEADHCVDAAAVPGILVTNFGPIPPRQSLKTLSGLILGLFR